MPLDPTNLSPRARASYIHLGRQFGSAVVLAQADRALLALAVSGDALIAHGFSAADQQRLRDARDALIEAGVARVAARGHKKIRSAEHRAAIAAGKVTRATAMNILSGARRALLEDGGPGADAEVDHIDAALHAARRAAEEAHRLADQLEFLHRVLSRPLVAAASEERGSPTALVELEARSAELRSAAAARSTVPGTPAATELLDVLEGMVITLVRQAWHAARTAARAQGTPALAMSFEMSLLYGSRASRRRVNASARAAKAGAAVNEAPPLEGNTAPPAASLRGGDREAVHDAPQVGPHGVEPGLRGVLAAPVRVNDDDGAADLSPQGEVSGSGQALAGDPGLHGPLGARELGLAGLSGSKIAAGALISGDDVSLGRGPAHLEPERAARRAGEDEPAVLVGSSADDHAAGGSGGGDGEGRQARGAASLGRDDGRA